MNKHIKWARPCISLFILLLCSTPSLSQSTSFNPKKSHYMWPTSASHALSSTFGETRAGHFHAALDIKTWGRRGYPVYATRSGTLFRIAIGPTGYGKVIYLKHDDGSYSVYAHLLRFRKSIQQWADSIRFLHYTSSIDMVVDSLNIHVKQGEKIGISGASGIGPPHLHFELRTPDDEPFNPLRTNLTIKDTRPPVFSGLAIEPLTIKSRIKGKNRIYTERASRGEKSAHFSAVNISGPVGLAVNLFDQANGVHNSYAVYILKMSVDGQPVFQSKIDQFSYRETHQMDIDRVYPLLQSTGRGYQRLYIANGNKLPFYQTWGNKGRLNLPAGRHHIVIKAADYFGNTRTATLTLAVQNDSVEPMIYRRPDRPATSINPSGWKWFSNWVNIPADEFRQLTLFPELSTYSSSLFFDNGNSISVNLKNSQQFYFRSNGTNYFISRRIEPSGPAYLSTPDNQAYASFPSGTFYDTTSVAIIRQNFANDSVKIMLFPDNHPIARKFDLSVKIDSLQMRDSTLSFYQYYPENHTLHKRSSRRKGDYLMTSSLSLGTFYILTDTLGPEIHRPRITKRPDGKWLIYLPVDDNRSGIDYQKTKIYVNGVRGLTEYEPEDNRLVYYHPQFTPKSTNQIKIMAFDKVGNETVKEMTIPFSK